jgi:hypothetical protein
MNNLGIQNLNVGNLKARQRGVAHTLGWRHFLCKAVPVSTVGGAMFDNRRGERPAVNFEIKLAFGYRE